MQRKKNWSRTALMGMFLLLALFLGAQGTYAGGTGKEGITYTLRYYSGNGSKLLYTEKVPAGGSVYLYKAPYADQKKCGGWFIYEGSEKKLYAHGAYYVPDKDKKIFLNEYIKILFRNKNGDTDFTKYVARGNTFTVPYPSAVTNYTSLGWSVNKDCSTLDYAAQGTMTAKWDTTLYACRKYTPYTVTFGYYNGNTSLSAFKKLTIHAGKENVSLPEVPAVKGYAALGWSLKKNSQTADHKAGDKVRVSKNITYYAVYRKLRSFQVKFCMADGSVPSQYASLAKTVTEGTVFTLPGIPVRQDYLNISWRLTINGQTKDYEPGVSIKVQGNYTFYAVQEKGGVTVTLKYNSGYTIREINVKKGTSITLPGLANPAGSTFMGWDTRKYRYADPMYEAGTVLPSVQEDLVLYSVLYNRKNDTSLILSQLGTPNREKYRKVIFVGDSRTYYMQQSLLRMTYNNAFVEYVCEPGIGLEWFLAKGYGRLIESLKAGGPEDEILMGEEDILPIAVIFNLGINDLGNLNRYADTLLKIAPELQKYRARLFFMSVNPVCGETRNSYNLHYGLSLGPRREADVRRFNQYMSAALSGKYTYIDIYSYLMQKGFATATWNTSGNSISCLDDGTHYSQNTYKRIFAECLRRVNLS